MLLIACLYSAQARPGREANTSPMQLVSVSLPGLKLDPGERVVDFHFDVQSGRIARLSDIPIGWDVSVDNDPSWNTKIEGSIRVGAAALDASFFRDFALIEKQANPDLPFKIQGEIDVSKDFSNGRKIRLAMSDFSIHPDSSPRRRTLSRLPDHRKD